MIPSEGAHDSNEQNVNDASKLSGGNIRKGLQESQSGRHIFFFLISPLSQSLSLSPWSRIDAAISGNYFIKATFIRLSS